MAFVFLAKVYIHCYLHLGNLRLGLHDLNWLLYAKLIFQELLVRNLIFICRASVVKLIPHRSWTCVISYFAPIWNLLLKDQRMSIIPLRWKFLSLTSCCGGNHLLFQVVRFVLFLRRYIHVGTSAIYQLLEA